MTKVKDKPQEFFLASCIEKKTIIATQFVVKIESRQTRFLV
jgi:hypothetical protein